MTQDQRYPELEEEAALLLRGHDLYATACARLKAAGERAADAEVTRRAAVQEMGQALADHRRALANHPAKGGDWRIDMEGAESLTGLSRRTLSGAVGTADDGQPPTGRDHRAWSDRALAAHCLAYGCHSHEAPMEELYRRYPRLAGLMAAVSALRRAEYEQWQATHDEPLVTWAEDPGSEPSSALQLLQDLHRHEIEAIAEGKAPRL